MYVLWKLSKFDHMHKVWVISHSQHSAMIRCPSKASEFKCCTHNKIHCMSCKEQQPLSLQELGLPQEVQFRACWKLSAAAFPSQTASLQEDWQVLEKTQTLHSKHQLISGWLYKQKQNITLWFIIITLLLTVTAWANSWQTSLVCIEFLSIIVHMCWKLCKQSDSPKVLTYSVWAYVP